MRLIKKIWNWIVSQFRSHTTRSLLVAVPALMLVTLVVLWACGVFRPGFPSFLPNREYILAETDPEEPKTLEELLHCDDPRIDTLLKNPSIAEELLAVKDVTDIADSRLALNNLRSLGDQLTERLNETPGSIDAALITPLSDTDAEQGSGSGISGVVTDSDASGNKPSRSDGTSVALAAELEKQGQVLTELKAAVDRLTTPQEQGDLVLMPVTMNMKGTCENDQALIHMIPSGDWLPAEGYKLYREVNGKSTLIADQVASPGPVLAGKLEMENADLIQELYRQAALTQDKLSFLGMSPSDFRETAYRTDGAEQKPRVDGELDFMKMKEALITIPNGIEQKIPATDMLLDSPIFLASGQDNSRLTSAVVKSNLWKNSSVIQSFREPGIDSMKQLPDGVNKYELAQSILAARQQIATLSFVDDEFAEEAGFLIRDDLSELGLEDGTKVTYRVETPDGGGAVLSVEYGRNCSLSKPQGLMGYGIDGKVPLRWKQPEDKEERSILSGYYIERRLDGESQFTQINDEPVVVTYVLDILGIYFESPVFYEDEVENGRTAEYRIRSIDVFGRTSEYSDVIKLRVEKVTPPNAPSMGAPVYSGDDSGRSLRENDSVSRILQRNRGKKGIAIPIYTDSADTVRFVLYRAKAVGARPYGKPEPIASLDFDKPDERERGVPGALDGSGQPERGVRKSSSPDPDMVYFDKDIREGVTYKYWVSAWDSWNNESAWSQSVTCAVPADTEPDLPSSLNISMLVRELPDRSLLPPGLVDEGPVTMENLKADASKPMRSIPGVDTSTVSLADRLGVTIGKFLNGTSLPLTIDPAFGNLPDQRYIHMLAAVRGEDVLPDGTARLKWPAYSGEGLAGYVVYRPMFEPKSLDEMQQMTRDELVMMGPWEKAADKTLTQNQLVLGGLDKSPGSVSLFLICLQPEMDPGIISALQRTGSSGKLFENPELVSRLSVEGGFVTLDWEAPEDPQVQFYRVYRAEVPSFKKPVDESTLDWTLVGDRLTTPKYIDPVEQSHAHYYYYKVVSVSPWGVESSTGIVERFRVPSTKPPQTPNLLLPLQRKDGVQINFSAVPHCDRYVVYRAAIPKISDSYLAAIDPRLKAVLFESPSESDTFLTSMLMKSIQLTAQSQTGMSSLSAVSRFKTLNYTAGSLSERLELVPGDRRLDIYQRIMKDFGPLALADYRDLSVEMMSLVSWEVVGELPADYDTAEAVDPATGLLKPLSIMDTTAQYGVMYLYTVQAWNDDNLGSTRAEPVEASPRRNRPFDPITGLKADMTGSKPKLSWDLPAMEPLTREECLEDTVGYIVYRADSRDGEYYQASPLLFEPEWTDEDADPFAYNWYKVKVLDTGGYLSDFSEPVLAQKKFNSNIKPFIPDSSFEPTAPTPSLTPESTPEPTPSPSPPHTTAAPPKLENREDEYAFKFFRRTGEYTVQLSATGSRPLSWSLKQIPKMAPVPDEVSIDDKGLLTIDKGISAGNYTFIVRVENEAGSDERQVFLSVLKLQVNPGRAGVQREAVSAPAAYSIAMENKHFDRAEIKHLADYVLTDISVSRLAVGTANAPPAYSGTAKLDMGASSPVPVKIHNAVIEKWGNHWLMSSGTVYISEPVSFPKLGITLSSLEISPHKNRAVASGFVKSTVPNRNLIGDLYALEFIDADLRNGLLAVRKNIPDIRHGQFTLHEIGEAWIRMNGEKTGAEDFIILVNSRVSMKSHLETLNNEGFEFVSGSNLTFDMQGRMSGKLTTENNSVQSLQLLVPGGAALRVESASLQISNDKVSDKGQLAGRLILPFERADAQGPGVPGTYAGGHPETNEMDRLMNCLDGVLPAELEAAVNEAIIKFGRNVQQNALLIVPDDKNLQDECAYIPIQVEGWNGRGFLVESAQMSSIRITERSLSIEKQRSQAIILTPAAVTVDLDRDSFLTREEGSQTPSETEKAFWTGMVIKGGKLTLPSDFVQSKEGRPIDFELAPGEMIYDLNGFNYQTYLYNDKGVPAQFGDALGGFEDVLVYDCMLDMYANRVNLEINAEVKLELFNNNWVKAKLYTNKEDNADGKKGEFLCSVAPTLIEDSNGEGIDTRIDGGFFKPDGMHFNGSIVMDTAEVKTEEPLAFTDMIVPSEAVMTSRFNDPERKYASVGLDKPTAVDFNGFTMEIRALDLECKATDKKYIRTLPFWLTLSGSTVLSENIPIGQDTTDSVIIKVREGFKPVVLYEESSSVLDAGFDDCIDVKGLLVPKLTGSDQAAGGSQGLMEFETEKLSLNYLGQLNELPVKTETRFGYDMDKKRCYFAVGLIQESQDKPINFGAGNIKDFTGIVTYNMTVENDGEGRYQFPTTPGQISGFIKNLQVHKGADEKFAAGVRGTMRISDFCEIRDLYFGFEEGPVINADGSVYIPLDIAGMIHGDGFKHVGSAVILYSHPQRYFSFSMTLEDINLVAARVSGSFGFEFSPHLFGISIGYPETLAGNIGIFRFGAGFAFRIDDGGDSYIRAKLEIGFEKEANITIVYLYGYLYAGADGAYYFDYEGQGGKFVLEIYLKGGIEGGVKVKGKKFDIISLYLDARGRIESIPPSDDWLLYCSATVSYSLDLWLFEVEGSVTASFDEVI